MIQTINLVIRVIADISISPRQILTRLGVRLAFLPILLPLASLPVEASAREDQILFTGTRSQYFSTLFREYVAQARLGGAEEIGFEVLGYSGLNRVVVPVYNYVGECPGEALGRASVQFTSSTTEPRPNRRVIIRNVTRGVSSDPFPFADREYENGRSSEKTNVTFNSRHNNRYFAVLPGRNQFEYEIREGDTVIERGSFIAEIQPNQITQARNRVEVEETYCATGQPLWDCNKKDRRVRKVYRCPVL